MRLAALLALATLAAPLGALGAQEPPDSLPPPDTVPADTAQVPPDTTAQAADTLADSVRVENLPPISVGAPAGWGTAVWSWDREALMGARAVTLLELLEDVPGMVPLRGGDFGSPEAVSALALGGGRVRLLWDGFEAVPLDGAVPDLALVGLGGLESVRVERGPGEVRIHVESLRVSDPRPFSLVEAGTGDLDTNLFRGTFVAPRALAGGLGLTLERLDTRGPAGGESGTRSGGWLRYGLHRGDDLGVVAEARRMRRSVDVDAYPLELSRTDWVVRARGRFLDSLLTAELFTGGSSVESGDDDTYVPVSSSRRQHGLRVASGGELWRVAASARLFGGPDLPSRAVEVEGGADLLGYGRLHGRWSSEAWAGEALSSFALHAWTTPFLGLSAFASFDDGKRGSRIFPPRELQPPDTGDTGEEEEPEPAEPGPTHHVTDRRMLRVGGSFAWGPLRLQGALLSLEADSLAPLGLVLDRGGPITAAGELTGWEAAGRIELPVDGFALVGSYQDWDGEARYLPGRIYRGAVDFHDVFLESGNLEVWGALGVRGRDPMLVPVPAPQDGEATLARVPFYQSWYADVQVRIVTVRLFIRWENFTVRDRLQDYPERILPATRAMYGVRWVLWN